MIRDILMYMVGGLLCSLFVMLSHTVNGKKNRSAVFLPWVLWPLQVDYGAGSLS